LLVDSKAVYRYPIENGFEFEAVKEYLESKSYQNEDPVAFNVESFVRENEKKHKTGGQRKGAR
jgi:hypothetical protein